MTLYTTKPEQKAKTATFGPVRPPLVIPNQMWEDIACWTAWLAYVAHDLIVIMKYENSFDVRMVDPESRLMQGPSLYWATACWEFARAHQAATDNPWHSATILEMSGKMASRINGKHGAIENMIQEHIIESKYRFEEVWDGIPVYEVAQPTTISHLLKQTLTTYEEAFAATRGLAYVNRRRIQNHAAGWPTGWEWQQFLKWPRTCPTCGASIGQPCISKPTNLTVKRHKRRRPPLA